MLLRLALAILTLASLLVPQTTPASGVVTNCTESDLCAALAGGGTVTFDCDGTITLSNTLSIASDAVLDATGRSVTISGANAVPVFRVQGGVSLRIIGLTLADGRGEQGGGIVNDGGQVHLQNSTLANHVALGTNGTSGTGEQGSGGAILNRNGVLIAVSCLFSNNQARGGKGGPGMFFAAFCGGPGFGGAIADDHGQTFLTNCQFTSNSAIGGDGGDFQFGLGGCGGTASGGALWSVGGLVTIVNTLFSSNPVVGGNGGNNFVVVGGTLGGAGGSASGGAVTLSGGRLDCTGCSFWRNTSVGGTGGRSQPGGTAQAGGISCESGSANLADCFFSENVAGAGFGRQESAFGPYARGGAVFNGGTTTVTRVACSSNSVFGGNASSRPSSGAGGPGDGGGFYNSGRLQIVESTLAGNFARGGGGALNEGGGIFYHQGGEGSGGGVYNAGELHLTNSTLTANHSAAGPGAYGPFGQTGPAGFAYGGAVFSTGATELVHATVSGNSGEGGALAASSGRIALHSSIVANSLSGSNCSGTIADCGYNISSDASCLFTNVGSFMNTDPLLGPLADNGGPTPTMALLPASPAVNGGDSKSCPPTDQRGVGRPQLGGCDIGAFELPDGFYILAIQRTGPQSYRLSGLGIPNQSFRVESTESLGNWMDATSGVVDSQGRFGIEVDRGVQLQRFYRIAAP
jgi:hypothetical protein